MREKVLAVDSDPFILSIIKAALEAAGYKVFTALDGESALEQFYLRQPDLVILEVMLPYLDGWGVCRRIRKLSKVPIIIHTSVESPEYLLQASKVGVCHYLVKPILPKQLRNQVDMTLKPQEQREQALPQSSRSLLLPEVTVAEYA